MAAKDTHGFIGPSVQREPWDNPLVARQAAVARVTDDAFNTPILNFPGVQSGSSPPDDTGDVGPSHFLQGDNGPGGSRVTIYDKSGNQLAQFNMESLATTGPCSNGYCDPIIQYDEMADRWLITEFDTSLKNLCVYVSTSPDPMGTWYVYSFNPAGSNQDYPKYAVWPDGYYVGVNNGGYVHVLDRVSMLAGAPATVQSFDIGTLPGFGFQLTLPATLEGDPPPAGEPAIFMRPVDTEIHSGYACVSEPCDLMELWALDVDWTTPDNSTLTQLPDVEIAEFDHTLCGTGSDWSCMPQPDTTQKLDPIREPLHFPLQYRNFGTHETLVGCFAEDVDGTDHAGVHWFEIRREGGDWTLYQEGVLGGEPNVHRSVCSAAMDAGGNIAVGYTRTGDFAPHYPSIYYSGRRASDPLGTMPYYDNQIWDAITSKTNNERWGDYSGIGVDPADGCTFWYTTEYGGSGNTRIATFTFENCLHDFDVQASPEEVEISRTGIANYSVDILQSGDLTEIVTLQLEGLPAGTQASLSPTSGTPPFSADLVVTTTTSTPLGTFPLVITGSTQTGITHADQVLLTVVAEPDLSIIKSAADQVEIGTLLEYDLQVTNNGGPATGLVISDSIPAGTSFAWAAGSGALLDDQAIWSGLSVPAGGEISATFAVTVSCLPTGTAIVNDDYMANAAESPSTVWGAPLNVTAVADGVTADFSFPEPVLVDHPVLFSNLSENATGYRWTLEEGANSTEVNPIHAYGEIGSHMVTLTATNICHPDAVASLPLTVEDYAVAVSPDTASAHGDPGEVVVHTLWITNTGTLGDTFGITVIDADWPTALAAGSVSLGAGEATSLEISVTVPADALGDELALSTVSVESLSDPRIPSAAAEVELTTVANTFYGVTLGPAESFASGRPGENVTYTLEVINTSNRVDTISFSRANTGWPTSFSDTSKTIARFGTRSIQVFVTIPENVDSDANDVALIQAIGSGGLPAEVTLTTTSGGSTLYLPIVLR
jgi:uncharacterized repeat protein (TIGR01451 family)